MSGPIPLAYSALKQKTGEKEREKRERKCGKEIVS
jgi:hypothetical protein